MSQIRDFCGSKRNIGELLDSPKPLTEELGKVDQMTAGEGSHATPSEEEVWLSED